MKNVSARVQGIGVHYYTVPDSWQKKGSSTNFTQDDWFKILKSTMMMDSLIIKHLAVMDKYDKNKKVGLMVDEWGTWYDVEPGTNPGFLYQQNTLRDALVAAINLNIFNNHADRVKMANIAQMINVLQAMILTKKEQMVLTPTYYVFRMYKVHQNATLIPLSINCRDYKNGDAAIPSINASASKDASGNIHITLANLDPNAENPITIDLGTIQNTTITGEVITAKEINDYNDFGIAPKVIPAKFEKFKLAGNKLQVTMPSKSVVALEVTIK